MTRNIAAVAIAAALAGGSGGAFATAGQWDTGLGGFTGSGATAASPWINAPAAGSSYVEWNFFDGYPTDTTPDIAANTSGSLTENSGAAFLTGGGNIYSFAAATDFSLVVGGGTPKPAYDVWLRIATLGTTAAATATLNGVANSSPVETFSAATGGGGFGGEEKEWYWKWNALPAAATLTFAFGASGSSMSLDQLAVYAVPVPEPGTWAMLVAGLGVIGMIARRRAARVV